MGLLHGTACSCFQQECAAPVKVTQRENQGQPGFAIPSLGYAQMKIDRDVAFMFYKAGYLQAS